MLSPGNCGGAPTKYKPIFAERKLKKYLKQCEEENKAKLIPTKTSYIRQKNASIPSQEGYAELLGVRTQTLRNWAERYPAFARALDRIRTRQYICLVNYGLSGYYKPWIAVLLLRVNHGMAKKKPEDERLKILHMVKRFYEGVDAAERELYPTPETQSA
ncbi:MAG: terminase small subunit [bacterium]|nr:terminase small subunit [bacterium]